MKITIIGKKAAIGQNKIFKMKGLSRMEYKFEYNTEEKRYIYEAKSQKEVEDIFLASVKLYRHFDFMPIMEEVKPAKKTSPKKKKEEPKLQAVAENA